jgi:hypothetical protein
MSAGAVGSAPSGAWLIQVLQSAQQAQVEMAEKLIATELQAEVQAADMEIAGQIIDHYA